MPTVSSVQAIAYEGARRTYRHDAPYEMWRGGMLPRFDLAYETWGVLNSSRSNAILVFTGLSPSAHAASSDGDPSPGWWEFVIGPGKPIDTSRHFVICVNSLGSCYGSTGPSSLNPESGQAYRLKFPELAIEDIAKTAGYVIDSLGIERLHTVLGPSLGGMAAIAFCMLFPERAKRLVAVSTAAHATPFAIAIRSLQRDMIRTDPLWLEGHYAPEQPPADGLRMARKLGLTSYRSGREWQLRFGRKRQRTTETAADPFAPEFEIESYLAHNAEKFVRIFDANSYLYLSRAMDWFDVTDHGGSIFDGLARLKTDDNLIIGVESDILFPLWQQKELADSLHELGRHVSFIALPSLQGHDSFLVDKDRFAPALARFFGSSV